MKLDEQPRPKLDLPITKGEIALEILSVLPIVLTLAVILINWQVLPDVVPSHFDLAGQANGWSNKSVLWLLFSISLGTSIALSIMCRFPHTFNYPFAITETNATRQYMLARKFLRLLKFELVMLLFVTVWTIIQSATAVAKEINPSQLFALTAILLASTVGYFLIAYLRR